MPEYKEGKCVFRLEVAGTSWRLESQVPGDVAFGEFLS